MDIEEPYWVEMPSDRHAGGANLSFADGHVEQKKWSHRSREYWGHGQPVENEADREDLIWLFRHSPLYDWAPETD